jgi:hypothetical protein
MLTTILALTIILKWWMLWATISVITYVIAYILDAQDPGSYIPIPACQMTWGFFNLIFWLIYFIIV